MTRLCYFTPLGLLLSLSISQDRAIFTATGVKLLDNLTKLIEWPKVEEYLTIFGQFLQQMGDSSGPTAWKTNTRKDDYCFLGEEPVLLNSIF